jgi:magnesium transporter
MIHFTDLDRLPVYDVKGHFIGFIADLLVDPVHSSLRVQSYLIKTPKRGVLEVAHEQMQSISALSAQTSVLAQDIGPAQNHLGLLHVRKDVLDQQVIDVDRRKVVRVNDVEFDIVPRGQHSHLRILAVNLGIAAAVRRMLQGVFAKHHIRAIANIFPCRAIPWEFINLIEPDPARRVQLKISYERLARLHPADLADILTELSSDEQRSVIESLDTEVAAETLAEIPDKNRTALLERVSASKAADLVEEMEPDEAADALQSLSPTASAEVLATMEQEEADVVRELLQSAHDTAGGLMTKSFVALDDTATVDDAIQALREFSGDLDYVHRLFLTHATGTLTGSVPIAKIMLADHTTRLAELSDDPVISTEAHDDSRAVTELFRKYNLVALPVVDDDRRLLGVVTVDDVLELAAMRS